jgi:hypothetical protein
MLIIEIAVGVFLGGMGLWLFVSHRDKKEKTEQGKRQEQLDFNAAERYVTERFKALTAECVNDFRGQLATIFDDPNRSAIEAASFTWKLSEEHLDEIKKQIAIDAREALKESLSSADRTGGRERLDQHIDHLISDSIRSVSNELMLMHVKELQSFNDDDLPSITHGHPRKQFNLGNAHRLGENVERDYGKAERLLRLSANQGYTDAEALLGFMYYAGEGVTRDYHEALKWLQLAARKDDAFAQNCLGIMYTHGYGVTQNHEEALRWIHLSAAQGFAAAQTNIGTMYYEGEGVGQDKVSASMWFILAAAKGDTDALNNLIVARRSMSPDQINQSERLALANDKNVLQFLLRQSEGLLPDPLSIYHDPVLLAGYFTDGYLAPLMTSYKELARPTRSEIEQWSITDFELSRCTEGIALLGAMGTVVTVKNNKSADYYSTFIHALAERVEKLLSWQDRVGARDEIIKVIEDYIDDLNNERIVEFACTFTERLLRTRTNPRFLLLIIGIERLLLAWRRWELRKNFFLHAWQKR